MPVSDPPWWHPDRFQQRQAKLVARTRITQEIRRLFRALDFIEVETPALQISPGMEPHLTAFATDLVEPFGGGRRLYLHTSPEFAMKKLLVAGVPRLFQLARVYRNGERSPLHHPEFTMLEWYRAGAGWRELVSDCQALLVAAADAAGVRMLAWRGRSADPRAAWEWLSVHAAFQRYAGIDLPACLGDSARLAAEARGIGIEPGSEDQWDDVFFRIFLDRIEPHLGLGAPTVLHGYPAAMAALARLDAADPSLAERFELYVAGVELANGFGELTDVGEQRRRFQADMALKERLYRTTYPIDEDFLAALEHGMPESAGIALGFDRLVMLATGAQRIDDVLWAPVAG